MSQRLARAALVLAGFTLAAATARTGDLEPVTAPRFILEIRDRADGRWTPARFSVLVNGREHDPGELGPHGLAFNSVHQSKRQVQTITYARGTGSVEFALPQAARRVEVRVAKGFEYLPVTVACDVTSAVTRVEVALARWANLAEEGWFATDEHVHYDRLDPAANRDWFTMMAGDDLSHVHFMMLKGGQTPGEWAIQYGYGPAGEGTDGKRLITAGEEYRDGAQGHINLLGVSEVIQPVTTGTSESPHNYPPFYSVLMRARALGGFNGAAHGGSSGRESTAIVDTVLGALDFFEIANPFRFAPDIWYQLMNCGYHLPPAGGTDLPNYPFRDGWQPFLGSMRMYVRVGAARDFATWRQVVQRNEVFVTAGPLLSFTVNGRGAGTDAEIATAGEVSIEAEMASPVGLQKFELILNGLPVATEIEKSTVDGVQRWRLRRRIHIEHSSWLAVRGRGVPIHALQQTPGPKVLAPPLSDAIAHSAAIRVLVGGRPIRVASELDALVTTLERQRAFYQQVGRFALPAHREEMALLFDRAIGELKMRRKEVLEE